MGSAAAKLKAANKAISEAKKTIKALGKEAMKELAAEFFTKNPTILSVSWNQYTPYFNDGDACVFQADTEYPGFTFIAKCGTTLQYDAASGELREGESEEEVADYEQYSKEVDKLGIVVAKFLHNFDQDTLEEMFGDHVSVTISNKGKISKDTYEHD